MNLIREQKKHAHDNKVITKEKQQNIAIQYFRIKKKDKLTSP